MAVLEMYRDPQLKVTGEMLAAWSPDQEVEGQIGRLLNEARAFIALQAIPRRLGADAGPRELARDKQLGRRMQHCMLRQACLWAKVRGSAARKLEKRAHELSPSARRAGAQLSWAAWDEVHCAALEHERRRIATFALEAGERSFGNWAAHLLTKEQEAVQYAFR